MNENEDMLIAQLERELRSLEPLAPDPLLCARLERRMSADAPASSAQPPRQLRRSSNVVQISHAAAWRRWAPWAAAAAVTAAVTVPQVLRQRGGAVAAGGVGGEQPAAAPELSKPGRQQERLNFQPVRLDREFAGLQQEEIVLDPVRGPVRRYRVNFSEHQEFQDPSSGSVLRIQFPVQDVIEVPAGVQ